MDTNGSTKQPDGNDSEQGAFVIGSEMARAAEAEKRWQQQGIRESPLPKQVYDFWHGDNNLINPAPNSLDDALREITGRYARSDPQQRAAIRQSINKDGFYTLMTFGQRSAVFAMRERKAEIARDGLIAVAMIDQERVDFRDILVCLSLLYHAASRVGANADAMFRQTATLAEPEVGKQMVGFVEQTSAHRNLRSSWGYDEIDTENGIGLVGWEFAEYHPTIDLKPLVMEVAQFLAADKYQPGTVAVASELPAVWLSHGKKPELGKILGRVRAGASISARLRPNEHSKHDYQQFTVFIVEASQTDDAKTLLRLSQTQNAREYSMLGVASGRLFSLIVARAFMDGVDAYETSKTIVRFEAGLTKILDRYAEKDK